MPVEGYVDPQLCPLIEGLSSANTASKEEVVAAHHCLCVYVPTDDDGQCCVACAVVCLS